MDETKEVEVVELTAEQLAEVGGGFGITPDPHVANDGVTPDPHVVNN